MVEVVVRGNRRTLDAIDAIDAVDAVDARGQKSRRDQTAVLGLRAAISSVSPKKSPRRDAASAGVAVGSQGQPPML